MGEKKLLISSKDHEKFKNNFICVHIEYETIDNNTVCHMMIGKIVPCDSDNILILDVIYDGVSAIDKTNKNDNDPMSVMKYYKVMDVYTSSSNYIIISNGDDIDISEINNKYIKEYQRKLDKPESSVMLKKINMFDAQKFKLHINILSKHQHDIINEQVNKICNTKKHNNFIKSILCAFISICIFVLICIILNNNNVLNILDIKTIISLIISSGISGLFYKLL